MRTRGFTLIELLGVLVILAALFVLVSTVVTNLISTSKETIYQNQINNILNATYDFTLKNISYLPNFGEKTFVTLGQLKYEGLVDADIKDPETKEKFPDNLVISINNVGAGYDYSNSYANLEGDYLYTVEIELLNDSSIQNLLPTITLESLTQNSDGNYIVTLDLNEEYNEISYRALSNSGEDITDRVVKYILVGDDVTDSIDTSRSTIYKVYYSVVDNDGYANISILNIIVADTTAPTISFPENNTITKETSNFDLMYGVSCDDNSGFCEIEFSGEIDYGVTGKYVITYTVTDPSGNTLTEKRIITIE